LQLCTAIGDYAVARYFDNEVFKISFGFGPRLFTLNLFKHNIDWTFLSELLEFFPGENGICGVVKGIASGCTGLDVKLIPFGTCSLKTSQQGVSEQICSLLAIQSIKIIVPYIILRTVSSQLAGAKELITSLWGTKFDLTSVLPYFPGAAVFHQEYREIFHYLFDIATFPIRKIIDVLHYLLSCSLDCSKNEQFSMSKKEEKQIRKRIQKEKESMTPAKLFVSNVAIVALSYGITDLLCRSSLTPTSTTNILKKLINFGLGDIFGERVKSIFCFVITNVLAPSIWYAQIQAIGTYVRSKFGLLRH
jgi:hypothetical protein